MTIAFIILGITIIFYLFQEKLRPDIVAILSMMSAPIYFGVLSIKDTFCWFLAIPQLFMITAFIYCRRSNETETGVYILAW